MFDFHMFIKLWLAWQSKVQFLPFTVKTNALALVWYRAGIGYQSHLLSKQWFDSGDLYKKKPTEGSLPFSQL
jgi:hypothetical protein